MTATFTVDFGTVPKLMIKRWQETDKIVDTFTSEYPATHIFMITGVRGSGKTVLMTDVSHKIEKMNSWVCADLNSESDMLNLLASRLSKEGLSGLKIQAGISAGGAGLQISTEKGREYSDVQVDLDEMLEKFKKKNKRLLITVDEAANTANMRVFTTYFQHCIRQEYPVFLLMTGLYKNINALSSNKTQTFLKRAPKIMLSGLNSAKISNAYMDVLQIDEEGARQLSRMVNGYPYAFQLLGYILTSRKSTTVTEAVAREYKAELADAVYDKIWEELSGGEREFLLQSIKTDRPTNQKIREAAGWDANITSTYKDALEKSGILSRGSARGYIEYALPMFDDYIRDKSEFEEI